ncbi:anaerobic C4-dicarboxylate transporter family protein [Staphylococcus sp. NRL 16/872]|uniref:anaerobic C4-dicarboxylate transporter family protein n=1 Tax=Staphylococcus sp. NRL 16/872 TaxID=2930131 RepID=UPI001FB3C613|nr:MULTISPECIES: anaerobic C4-dicarboxylate transporter family protein [unclassified Staphylococcus]MCJ1655474.1 anaerobic C4-dicarboxylate transporter family protein [Staphylococcus sp. NRL 21/187]MCJ1661309.1 anaerobic C4-dicarboxylate transporter family protein [Staphylococcus sp. NRL 18/288]MCJ1667196.1 anaerobic C4-dicarboxylate transporter family protein [Staphylococcus sp. NRL 19/737]WEN69676.1 anaerobic C4-dicarboxylate transporter family protein [Staphylococcus sp. NRL 16/872]
MLLFVVEIAIMILAILLGLRTAGALGCGIFAIVAQLIMIFGFQLPPGSAPVTAVLIILSIGIAGGTLQATGGIDYLVYLASKIIERFPRSIIFIAPMIVFLFVFGVGTANIALSLEPIIAKTAVKAKIQPKRPLTASVLTANLALLCSPAASATAYIISVMAGYDISMGKYLSIVLPTAIITMLLLSVFCTFVGRKTTVTESEIAHTPDVEMVLSFSKKVKIGVIAFLLCVVGILTFGIFPDLMPTFKVNGKEVALTMTEIVQFFMYLSVAVNLLLQKINTSDILSSNITQSAIGALFAVLGPGWLGATIFNAPQNLKIIRDDIGKTIQSVPWLVIILVAVVAMIVISQTATASIMVPIVMSMGIPPMYFIAMVQTLNVNFVIPAQPTILFAVNLDETGRTRPTSFIIPGFFAIIVSVIVGFTIKMILGY